MHISAMDKHIQETYWHTVSSESGPYIIDPLYMFIHIKAEGLITIIILTSNDEGLNHVYVQYTCSIYFLIGVPSTIQSFLWSWYQHDLYINTTTASLSHSDSFARMVMNIAIPASTCTNMYKSTFSQWCGRGSCYGNGINLSDSELSHSDREQ